MNRVYSMKTTSICLLSVSLLGLIVGCYIDSAFLAILFFVLAVFAAFVVASAHRRPSDDSPRQWGESVWQAAGRQISTGSSGWGPVFGVCLVALAIFCLVNDGEVLAFALLGGAIVCFR